MAARDGLHRVHNGETIVVHTGAVAGRMRHHEDEAPPAEAKADEAPPAEAKADEAPPAEAKADEAPPAAKPKKGAKE